MIKIEKIIFWGGTGQAKIMRYSLINKKLVAIFDHTNNLKSPFHDIPLYHSDMFNELLPKIKPDSFLVTIGNPNSKNRINISKMLCKYNLKPSNVINTNATIAQPIKCIGIQVSPGANIGVDVTIGNYCIINSLSNIEHDVTMGDGVEIGPSATICGNVHIDDYTWIGANSVIRQNIKIGRNCIVGAGSVVVKNIPNDTIYVGNPAKKLRNNK